MCGMASCQGVRWWEIVPMFCRSSGRSVTPAVRCAPRRRSAIGAGGTDRSGLSEVVVHGYNSIPL